MFKKKIILFILIIALVGLITVTYVVSSFLKPKAVHWHAKLNISICGENKELPRIPLDEHHFGTELIHTHDDNIIHVEGIVDKNTDISLGRFFEVIGVTFNERQIFGHKNGDSCDNNKGNLKMFVNGKRSYGFRNYTPKDGDLIAIVFE